MRLVFAQVLTWFVVTLVVTAVAVVVTTSFLSTRSAHPDSFLPRLAQLHRDEAREAYERGGRRALTEYLAHLSSYLPDQRYLLDRDGRDVLTGDDRSTLLASARHRFGPMFGGSQTLEADPTPDGAYTFVVVTDPLFSLWTTLPVYGWIFVMVVFLAYAIAVTLMRPLRELHDKVVRFGQGDLTARVGSKRRDGFGDLARAFDDMAERIQVDVETERRLLHDISHELRSPLTRLSLALALARAGGDSADALRRAQLEVERLSQLSDELVDVVRLDASAEDARVRNDLVTLVASIVEAQHLEANQRGCRILPALHGAPMVDGDPRLIWRAVENVLRNAIRHAPPESTVSVAVEPSDDTVAIVVRDSGPGVPDSMLADIFRPFFRVETDRGRASGGVGLGLAIVQRAVQVLGGDVVARNAHPGLAVEIRLPLAREGTLAQVAS
ncbi:MAG: ATP-binding protein [Vicinamibacterales bacterium]